MFNFAKIYQIFSHKKKKMALSVNIRWLDSVDSTNSCLDGIRDTAEDMTVIAATDQKKGRGQRGNTWESKAGENLTFSILYKHNGLPVKDQFAVTEAVSLAIVEYLGSKGVEASIKWPNDIYSGDRKICGILIENHLSSDFLSDSVVGIGLNINQKDFPSSIPNPVSLSMITGRAYDIKEEMQKIAGYLSSARKLMGSWHDRNYLDCLYMDHLYRRGLWCSYEALPASDIPTEKRSGERFTARILGIDNNFRLLLEKRDGHTESFAFKELKQIL